jgi:hypothetical protein
VPQERGPDIRPGKEQRTQRPEAPTASKPRELSRAHDYLDVGAGLAKERGGLDSALSSADDDDSLTPETGEVDVVARMRAKVGRQTVELGGPPHEWRESGSDDHPPCFDGLAIREQRAEAIPTRLDGSDAADIDVRRGALLEPVAIGDKSLARSWLR